MLHFFSSFNSVLLCGQLFLNNFLSFSFNYSNFNFLFRIRRSAAYKLSEFITALQLDSSTFIEIYFFVDLFLTDMLNPFHELYSLLCLDHLGCIISLKSIIVYIKIDLFQ